MLSFKIGITNLAFRKSIYKNIATNDDYINNYCVPIQSDFIEKCIMW